MKVNANTLRKGIVVDYNNKLWIVADVKIRQPGKGNAVIQVEMRDVLAGNKTNVRFATQEKVETVRLEEMKFQFLYSDGNEYTFMNNQTYDQITVQKDLIGDAVVFLQDGMIVIAQMHDGKPLSITLPEHVTMNLTEADPVIKGQTASSSYKPALLENGVRIMVPPHIESGIRIVVRTSDASYVEKAKD